jgi:hypothetical protein
MALSPTSRVRRFLRDVVAETPFVKMLILLVCLWVAFSVAMYLAESGARDASIRGLLDALYWGVAALTVEELEVLKRTTDTLIEHMEGLKSRSAHRPE